MATRWQNSPRTTDRVPNTYASNRLYKGTYARTDYQSRTSRRLHDGLVLAENYGLDTTADDVNSSPYSSPYYINGRYNSDNIYTQSGNSSSVQGTKYLLSLKDSVVDFSDEDVQTTISMWQGKQIKFEVPYSGKVVGHTLRLKNTGGCTGILAIYFSTADGGEPIAETAIDLCQISEDKFEHKTVRNNLVIPATANPRGKLYVRMEIYNEISQERSENPFNTGRKIEIASTGLGNHYFSVVELGDKNEPISESIAYERAPSRPCMGFIYNNYESVPTNRTEASATGASVSLSGYRYDIFCIKDENHAEVLIYDKIMNTIVEDTNIAIDGRVTEMNLIQAKDYVYYVDGYSPLQKFKIGEWVSSALPLPTGEDEDKNPVVAPSIITFHNNRVYLAGFRYDPNLLQFTEIDESGPQFENFTYRAYVPDESPLRTSNNPITAIVEEQSDTLMICGKTFYSTYQTDGSTSGATAESAMPVQVSTYTDGGGVQTAGDICNHHGVIYSFDADEGIRRFNGSIWSKVPLPVDTLFERVDMSKPRKLWGYATKLYFNYRDKVDGKYKCIVWDMDMGYQQYPVFLDVDLPFCDVRYDDDFDIVGIHPDYPCIMQLYAEDTWRRMDTPITFERHTKRISLPGNVADMILKRVHNKVLANANRWWWFGVTYDKHELTQYRGKVNTYRMPCWDTLSYQESAENVFNDLDVYEENALAVMTIPNIKARAISAQCLIKCKTFRAQACLVSTVFEAGARQYN